MHAGSSKLEVVTAVFVDRTTDGDLMELMRRAEQKLSSITGYRVKIVEKNGLTLGQSLVQRDPFVGWPCGRECGVCMWKPIENTKENCNLQNVVYRGICLLCEAQEKARVLQKEEEEEK